MQLLRYGMTVDLFQTLDDDSIGVILFVFSHYWIYLLNPEIRLIDKIHQIITLTPLAPLASTFPDPFLPFCPDRARALTRLPGNCCRSS